MKKLKLFAVALLIGTTGLFASEISTIDDKKPTIETQIAHLLEKTDLNIDYNSNVRINFTFNSEGEIVVLKVSSQNNEVLDYIRTNLNGKTIKNPGKRDKIYHLSLKIQSI